MFRAVPLPIIMAGIEFHQGPARKLSSNRMTLVYSTKCTVNGLLTMGRGTARNM